MALGLFSDRVSSSHKKSCWVRSSNTAREAGQIVPAEDAVHVLIHATTRFSLLD